VRIPYGLCLQGALLPGWTYPSLLRLGCTVPVPQVLTETITPSFPVDWGPIVPRGPCSICHLARARERLKWVVVQGRPRAPKDSNPGIRGKMGGSPRTPKGIQGLHPGIMLSRAQYVAPPLQLGIRGPPWRPHGVSVELEEALWATKKFPENSEGSTGDPW